MIHLDVERVATASAERQAILRLVKCYLEGLVTRREFSVEAAIKVGGRWQIEQQFAADGRFLGAVLTHTLPDIVVTECFGPDGETLGTEYSRVDAVWRETEVHGPHGEYVRTEAHPIKRI